MTLRARLLFSLLLFAFAVAAAAALPTVNLSISGHKLVAEVAKTD